MIIDLAKYTLVLSIHPNFHQVVQKTQEPSTPNPVC